MAYNPFVTCTYYWIIVDGEYAGSISLRHELNEYLKEFGGHIGYSARPGFRKRGIATRALSDMLARAADKGISEVLLTCNAENSASQQVIRMNGGMFRDATLHDGNTVYRYTVMTRGR